MCVIGMVLFGILLLIQIPATIIGKEFIATVTTLVEIVAYLQLIWLITGFSENFLHKWVRDYLNHISLLLLL